MPKPLISFTALVKGFKLKNQQPVKKWILSAILAEKKSAGQIGIVFCTDNYLLDTNKKYLNHNYYTDIITFQYPDNQKVNGDLLISIDRVAENAEKLKTGFENELHRVMIHGILHLCGYGDKTKAQKMLMTKKEDYYLTLRSF